LEAQGLGHTKPLGFGEVLDPIDASSPLATVDLGHLPYGQTLEGPRLHQESLQSVDGSDIATL